MLPVDVVKSAATQVGKSGRVPDPTITPSNMSRISTPPVEVPDVAMSAYLLSAMKMSTTSAPVLREVVIGVRGDITPPSQSIL